MAIVARCNGTLLVQTERGLGIAEQGGGWYGTAIFVAVLVGSLTLIGGGMLAAAALVPGIVMAGVGALSLAVAVTLVKRRRRTRDVEPTPWLVFDLDGRQLLIAGRTVELDQVRLERVFQVGSSSKALTVRCPDKIVIARGTPFGDDVDGIEQALRARGIG